MKIQYIVGEGGKVQYTLPHIKHQILDSDGLPEI